jgi:ribosomal protein S18 acetylase RimI-like enzyme
VTADLPAGWTTRRPTLEDAREILAVVHASDIACVGEPDFTTEEIVEIFSAPGHDPQRDSWLALNATGRVMGWAYLDNPTRSTRDLFDVYVHPDGGQPAQAHLLDLVLARIPERAKQFGHPRVTARAGVIASETEYVALLQTAGFQFIKRYARMQITFTGAVRLPEVPSGVTIRTVRHEDDAEMRTFYGILKTAFDDLPDSVSGGYDDYRARLAALPSITWSEWFIADVGGVPAGILQSADQSGEQNEGWVKYLGVAKEFRGQGLGRLLLQTAFATYAARGRTGAGLGVDLTNPTGAYGLYESVGMSPAYESDVYEREFLIG